MLRGLEAAEADALAPASTPNGPMPPGAISFGDHMTLVVARVVDGFVRILSDWKVTYEDPRQSTPLTGTLKAIAVSPDSCVAYSTNSVPEVTERIRTTLESVDSSGVKSLAQALCPSTVDDLHEFLVASRAQLYVVKAGTVRPAQAAWLGDYQAFTEYQRQYHETHPFMVPATGPFSAEYFATISRMSTAFDAVLRDTRFPTVEGFKIVLTSRSASGEGFHYLPASAGFDFQPVTGGHGQSLLTPTPASGGGYNYSVLVPETFGVAAIGAYFLQGKFGALFRPLDIHSVVMVRAATAEEFLATVEDQFGLRLSGPYWSVSSEGTGA